MRRKFRRAGASAAESKTPRSSTRKNWGGSLGCGVAAAMAASAENTLICAVLHRLSSQAFLLDGLAASPAGGLSDLMGPRLLAGLTVTHGAKNQSRQWPDGQPRSENSRIQPSSRRCGQGIHSYPSLLPRQPRFTSRPNPGEKTVLTWVAPAKRFFGT